MKHLVTARGICGCIKDTRLGFPSPDIELLLELRGNIGVAEPGRNGEVVHDLIGNRGLDDGRPKLGVDRVEAPRPVVRPVDHEAERRGDAQSDAEFVPGFEFMRDEEMGNDRELVLKLRGLPRG